MMSFVEGEADVLLATNIVESGLDIPRANTIVVCWPKSSVSPSFTSSAGGSAAAASAPSLIC